MNFDEPGSIVGACFQGMPKNPTFTFYDGEKVIGTLYLESPMRFEGDADESARLFFDNVIERATGEAK
jgi:hypothetical protein